MNLKESFRYQKFLDTMMGSAASSIYNAEHCLKTTKRHLMNKVNPDAEDKVEEVEPDTPFFDNDSVIRFMEWLVEEKQRLSCAIDTAKASVTESLGFDIDAAIESNKLRQQMSAAIKSMLRRNAGKRIERGTSWKFNNEGVQSSYYYDVEVETMEAFNREKSKEIVRSAVREADRVSSAIDAALINTVVDFDPVYDVNESFDDVMAEFIAKTGSST